MTNPMLQYALLIGVGQRADDTAAMAITATDAEKMATELENRCEVPSENSFTLINQEATQQNILDKLDHLIAATQQEKAELVWVYFSGHGGKINQADQTHYVLVCHDTQRDNVLQTGIRGAQLMEKLKAIQTDKLVLLLDCCHAGGMSLLQKTNVPFDATELLEQPNRVVLSASHAEQLSYVSEPVSLFTYALIEGLAGSYFEAGDKMVTVFDLAMYIRERVYPLSKRKQQPQLNVLESSKTNNFVLVHYPNGKPKISAFDTEFKLFDGYGKQINTALAPERDEDWRKQFEWLKQRMEEQKTMGTTNINKAIIKGNDNITIQGVDGGSKITINK